MSVARYAYDGVEVLGGKIYLLEVRMVQVPKILPNVMIQQPTLGRPSPICLPLEKGLLVRCSNGKLYAIGGDGLSSVEVFDPSNDSWSAGVSLPSEVNRGTAITVDGKIYLSVVEMRPSKTSTKCFALIPPPVNGVPKPICPRQGMESNLFGLRIEFGRLVA